LNSELKFKFNASDSEFTVTVTVTVAGEPRACQSRWLPVAAGNPGVPKAYRK
jgi:hypothetical protein